MDLHIEREKTICGHRARNVCPSTVAQRSALSTILAFQVAGDVAAIERALRDYRLLFRPAPALFLNCLLSCLYHFDPREQRAPVLGSSASGVLNLMRIKETEHDLCGKRMQLDLNNMDWILQ